MVDPEPGMFLYDGDCAVCSRAATLAARLAPSTPIVAWQHVDIAALGLTNADCDAAVQWVPTLHDGSNGQILAGPDAIGALLRGSPTSLIRAVGRLFRLRATSSVAWPMYRLVARNRHRLPGGTATCSLPQADRSTHTSEGGVPPGPDAILTNRSDVTLQPVHGQSAR